MSFLSKLTEEERAQFEKIEEKSDIAVYNAAYKEYEESGKHSRPIEELWKELDIGHRSDIYKK